MPRLRAFRYDRWAEAALTAFKADSPAIIAVDCETTGVSYFDEPFGATVSWLRHQRQGDASRDWYFDLETPGTPARILGEILRATPAWVGHNLKFDLQKLVLAGVISRSDLDTAILHDTQTMYHLLDENSTKGLKDLAIRVLGIEDVVVKTFQSGPRKGETYTRPREDERLQQARNRLGLKKSDGYHLLPRPLLIPYALKDTEFTIRLYWALLTRLAAKKDARLSQLYEDEMILTEVFLDMEAEGIAVDVPYTETTASEYGVKIMESLDVIAKLSGREDFNPGSWQQIQTAFQTRGVLIEDTKASTLEDLDDDLARAIVAWREDTKIHTTYLKGLLKEQRGGVFHPNFNITGARTGRMSSGSAKE